MVLRDVKQSHSGKRLVIGRSQYQRSLLAELLNLSTPYNKSLQKNMSVDYDVIKGGPKMQTDMEVNADILGILNAYNYWDEIALPNWIDFTNLPTPRNALNLAYSLWHLLDWIKRDKRHAFIGQGIEDVRQHFIKECPMLGVIHDISTFGKHAKVSQPKGNVVSAEAQFIGAVLYFGSEGPRSEHPSKFTVILKDGRNLDLLIVFDQVISYWDSYFKIPRPSSIAIL